jgi:cytochrome c biogenesis protein CcmG, thiol:disulfide interchange protein DsbE
VCRRELPGLDQLAEKYDGRVNVLGVVAWGSGRQAEAFAKSKGISHLPLVEGGGPFADAMGVDAVPTTFFVKADGTVIGRLVGMGPEWLFRHEAERLLAEAR